MGNINYTQGTGIPHRSFEEEFLTHKKDSEWWYSTGYFSDEENNEYAYQFTLARIRIFGIRFHVILTALTDITNKKHFYGQQIALFNKGITTSNNETTFGKIALMKYSKNNKSPFGKMDLTINAKDYSINFDLDAKKAPVWHCDEGLLLMGNTGDPKDSTYYYSITNLDLTGTLELKGKRHTVKGKAWYDKQGGTYHLAKPVTNWEWFSFRFFDGEEIMLFPFPNTGYKDGTYIKKDGQYERLNDFTYEPLGFIIEPTTGYKFSYGWKFSIPNIKGEEYLLKPRVDGQFNVAFYELIADIYDKNNDLVGYCIIELLPGARNKKLDSSLIFRKKV